MPEQKIKVLHVLSSFDNGGVEKVVLNYCNHLDMSKIDLGFTCYIGEQGILRPEFEKLSNNIYVLPKKRHIFKTIFALRKILKKEKYDVIHVHLSFYSAIPLFAALCTKTKVRIAHYHLAIKHLSLFQKLCNLFNKLFATSIFYCGEAAFYDNGFKDKKRHYYMANAIDQTPFLFNDKNRRDIRKEYGISDNDVCIGTIGRICLQKNPIFFIKFMKEYLTINPHSKFLYVGYGEMEEELKQEIRQNGLEKDIIMVGNRLDAYRFYSAFDLFLIPSFFEGLSISMLEAQINGVPILASDTIDKQVNFSETIVFNSLEKDVKDWALKADELVKNRNKFDIDKYHKSGFSIDTCAEQLIDEYKSLINLRRKK